MELSVQMWGNSAAVRLPTELLAILKFTLGDKLAVDVRADGVLLKAKRRAFSLDELVAQCNSKVPEPADMAAWSRGRPAGRETE